MQFWNVIILMVSKEIKNIIAKYLSNQASSSELAELGLWIKDVNNEEEFYNYVKTNYAIDYNLKKFNTKLLEKKLLAYIENDKKTYRIKRYRNIGKIAAAASVVLILTLTIFLRKEVNTKLIEPAIVNSIEPGTDRATLTLDDGSQIALEKGASIQTRDANSNGKEIIYKPKERKTKEVAYNYLTIPRGGQFFIKLSDGTKVWLNSESQLKYPVNFIKGETRKVELVYGEAYFDVSSSSEHNGSSFKVYNQSQEIEVLGTEFNIEAYKDETNIYTTLVEGKVSVNSAISNQILKPNQQTNLNLKEKSLTISEVDVYNETSWKDGVFSFQRKSLGDIMKVLSRWYNIDVQFNDVELKNAGFNGAIGKDQKLEDILETIKNFGVIENYEIEKQRVILK